MTCQELNLSFHERINKYDYNSPIRVIKECIENDISSTKKWRKDAFFFVVF